jgi:hypothetical protein
MTEHKSYKSEIVALKFFDIFLLSGYYVIAAVFIASFIDYIVGRFSRHEEDKKSTLQLIFETIFYTFGLLIVFYIVRNIIERIPFPFEGMYGFKHALVKEKSGDVVFVFILLYFQHYYTEKLRFLHNRVIKMFGGDEVLKKEEHEI